MNRGNLHCLRLLFQPSVCQSNCNTSSPSWFNVTLWPSRPICTLAATSAFSLTCIPNGRPRHSVLGQPASLSCEYPTSLTVCIAFKLPRSSQFYFAWQVYAWSQRSFMKYVVSGTVAILSLLAFGDCIARDNYYRLTGFTMRFLTAGGLGKSEMINGPRLCPDVWPRMFRCDVCSPF